MTLTVKKQLTPDYVLSKYNKEEQEYEILTIELQNELGQKFHHNIHDTDRVGGVNKDLMNDFDEILRKLVDNNSFSKKKVVIHNLKEYNFTCSVAKRRWIQPTEDTVIEITGLFSTETIFLRNKVLATA